MPTEPIPDVLWNVAPRCGLSAALVELVQEAAAEEPGVDDESAA